MWKTLVTILLGRSARVEQRLETGNAALIIEQKLREAENGHDAAKRGLAALIARAKTEKKTLTLINVRIVDLETRTRQALQAGKESLASDAAKLLADLENEQKVRTDALAGVEEKIDRTRLAIEKTQRHLVDLKQGLLTAQSIEAERSALARMKGDLSANSALREGEAVLQRLLDSEDPIEQIDALEEIEADLNGASVIDRLSEAGFGKAVKVRAEDVLERFRTEAFTPGDAQNA